MYDFLIIFFTVSRIVLNNIKFIRDLYGFFVSDKYLKGIM